MEHTHGMYIKNCCRDWNTWAGGIGGVSQSLIYLQLRFQRWYWYLQRQSLSGILRVNYWDCQRKGMIMDVGCVFLFNSDGIFEALACTSKQGRSWWYTANKIQFPASRNSQYKYIKHCGRDRNTEERIPHPTKDQENRLSTFAKAELQAKVWCL